MIDFSVNNLPDSIVIGRQTEKGVEQVRIDCTPWLERWPDLSFSVWVTPPGCIGAYPASIEQSGGMIIWNVNEADTAKAGMGTVEICGTAVGKKKLSASTTTYIFSTTTGTTAEPPDPEKPWVDNVLDAAERAEKAAKRAEAAGGGSVTPEQIADAVEDYLTENPIPAPDPYILPPATADTLGGVMVGDGLQVDEDGKLSAVGGASDGIYELIETFTPGEDMAFERTQEPDGTPYNFSAITLLVKKPKDITIASSISINAYISPSIIQPLYMPPCSKAEELWGLATVERHRGRFRRTRVGDWYIFNSTSSILEVPFQMFRYEFPENAAIYRLYTSAILPAGLTFEIWGVRA